MGHRQTLPDIQSVSHCGGTDGQGQSLSSSTEGKRRIVKGTHHTMLS